MASRVGELAIDTVTPIDAADITEDDARRAGHPDRAALLAELTRGDGVLFRIAVRFVGADPRIALREQTPDDLSDILRKLADMDRRHGAPWTQATLAIIAERPATRAGDLAAGLGEPELQAFKIRVRRLKTLGLTESLEVGYRLSPRGLATLGALRG